jgi:hypothetical protein
MLPLDQDPTAHWHHLPRDGQGLTGIAERRSSTAGLDGEEAGVIGDAAEWWRQLDSSAWHRRRLQRWPISFESRRSKLPEFGRFQEGEEEKVTGEWCYGGVLHWASKGFFYRLGGERECGHELGAVAGNFPCAAAPAMAFDAWVIRAGTAAPPHALWHHSLTLATARMGTLIG